jgi:hypothetical protein
VATCTGAPLLMPFVVTTAFKLPRFADLVVKITVKEVLVAAVTTPIAVPLKVTVLLPGVVLKPVPLITMLVAVRVRLVVRAVTTGLMRATWTAVLLTPLVVTVAVRAPAVGLVEKVTVRAVAVAAETVPTAPLLKTTVLLPGVVLKPEPLIVTVLDVAATNSALAVMAGATLAT